MECKKCGNSWETSVGNTNTCPFCGVEVPFEGDFESIGDVLRYIFDNYGDATLYKRGVLVSLVSDLAPQFSVENRFLQICLESGILADFISVRGDAQEKQEIIYKKSRTTLETKYGLSSMKSCEILSWLTSAFGIDITSTKTTDKDNQTDHTSIKAGTNKDKNITSNPLKGKTNKSRQLLFVFGVITSIFAVGIIIFIAISKLNEKIQPEIPTVSQTETNGVQEMPAALRSVDYNIGDIILFGNYDQDNNLANGVEPIEWIIIDVEPEQCLVLSKYALDCKQYNSIAENTTWEKCSLRYWLNNSFLYSAFSEEDQKTISTNKSPLSDKVFVLSKEEVLKYFTSSAERKTRATETAIANGSYQENGACGWWLRDAGDTSLLAARVNKDGNIVSYDSSEGGVERRDYSVRPAMWIETN